MSGFFKLLSTIVSKFKWVIVTSWMFLLIVMGMLAGQLTPLLSGGGWTVEDSGSLNSSELLS